MEPFDLKEKDANLLESIGDMDKSEIKKKKMKRLLIIFSVILLVIIIALVFYFSFRSDDEDEDEDFEDEDFEGNDNCLSFVENSTECASCNPYFRLENGACLFIFSFEAIYNIRKTSYKSDGIKLFNVEYLGNYKINKIQVDDKFVKTKTNYYKFYTVGEHKVRVNIDLKKGSSLNKFFENINELVSINFTNEFNTKGVENMDEMFSSTKNLVYLNMPYLNTENVRSMKNMFKNCEQLEEIDISNFKTEKVENMFGMFENSGVKNLDLTNFKTKTTTNMGNMFKNCKYLKFLNLDFNTENVENMENMFSSCISLTSLNISMFDIYDSTDVTNMFENDRGLKIFIDSNRCEDLIYKLPGYVIINKVLTKIGEINCIYEVENIYRNNILLGNEFSKNSRFSIY